MSLDPKKWPSAFRDCDVCGGVEGLHDRECPHSPLSDEPGEALDVLADSIAEGMLSPLAKVREGLI